MFITSRLNGVPVVDEKYWRLTLPRECEGTVDKIRKLKPELKSHASAVARAIDQYYEWLIQFSKEERAVMESFGQYKPEKPAREKKT